MKWILLAMIAGSLVVSQHSSEEDCEGRKAMVQKQKAEYARCVDLAKIEARLLWWDNSNTCLNCDE